MSKTDFYPALINWPLVVIGCFAGFFIGLKIGPFHTSWIIIPLVIGSEFYRVYRITKSLPAGTSVSDIRLFYSRDLALKYVPTKSQIAALNEFLLNQKEK